MIGGSRNKINDSERMTFGQFVDKTFWFVITSAAVFAASEMKGVSTSVAELNQKVAVVITQISSSAQRIDAQDRRIERLEDRLKK